MREVTAPARFCPKKKEIQYLALLSFHTPSYTELPIVFPIAYPILSTGLLTALEMKMSAFLRGKNKECLEN